MAGPYAPFADKESRANYEALVAALRERDGVAVLGAGASHPLPGWTDLYTLVRSAAALEGVNLLPDDGRYTLPALFATAHDQEPTPGWLLSQLANELRFTGAIPETYELVRSIQKFHAIHTFNYDENLLRCADTESATHFSYPFDKWDRKSFRFMYLHGSLIDARSLSDLVLCEHDYDEAYDSASVLVDILNAYYKHNPVLFIGCSLSDEYYRRALYMISRGVQFLHSSHSGEFIAAPNWFVLLKHPDSAQEKALILSTMKRRGVRVIWYGLDEESHDSLYEALNVLKLDVGTGAEEVNSAPGTVLAVRAASRAASIPEPNAAQVHMTLGLLQDAHARDAFFSRAESPAWFAPLQGAGLLDPDEPEETSAGRTAKAWAASDYLVRIAQNAPGLVAPYLSRLTTSNWIAARQLANVLAALPAPEFWSLGKRVSDWVETLPSDELIHMALRRLASEDGGEVRYRLLLAIARSVSRDQASNFLAISIGAFAQDAFLDQRHGDSASARALAKAMDEYAQRTWGQPGDDASWIERRAIYDDGERSMNPGLDWLCSTSVKLLEGMRDDARASATCVAYFLKSRWPLTRRLAFYEMSLNSAARASLEQQLARSMRRGLSSPQVYHELTLLMEAVARSEEQSDKRILLAVMSELARPRSRLGARALHWQRIIDGQSDGSDRFLFGAVEVFTPTAPLSPTEIAERFGDLSAKDLIAVCEDPLRFSIEVGWRQDRDLIWEALSDYIRENNRLDVVLALDAATLQRNEYASSLVRALPDLALTKRQVASVGRWMRAIVSSGSPRATAAALDAARTMAASQNAAHFADDLALDVIRSLGARTEHPLETGAVWSEGELPDVMLRQLNDPAGKAAQVLVESFLSEHRQAGSIPPLPEWALSFGLSPSWDIVECRVALGEIFPFIVASDPVSAGSVAGRVLAESQPLLSREAFWNGYCWRAQPHRQTLETLAPFLCRDVQTSSRFRHSRGDVKDALAAHAAIGLIQEIPGYGELPSLIFESADDTSLERFIRATGNVLHGADDALLANSLHLFTDLVDRVRSNGRRGRGGLTAWLRTVRGKPMPPQGRATFRRVFELLPDEDVYFMLQFVSDLPEADSATAAALLQSMLQSHLDAPQLSWHQGELISLLFRLGEAHWSAAETRELVSGLLSRRLVTPEVAARLLKMA